MTDLRFDEEATKGLLALYVTPEVVAQRAQFLCALEPRIGERVLDVGSGPGFLAAWEQHAADAYLPRTLATKLSRAGFRMQAQQVIPLFNSSYDTNTFSNRIIDLIVPFVAGRNGITRDEAEGWAKDLRQTGEQGEFFFSLNRYLFIAQKGP